MNQWELVVCSTVLKIHYSASEWKHGGRFKEVVSCTRGEAPTLKAGKE